MFDSLYPALCERTVSGGLLFHFERVLAGSVGGRGVTASLKAQELLETTILSEIFSTTPLLFHKSSQPAG